MGHAHINFPEPRGEHGVDTWILQQVPGKLGTACRALCFTMVDILFEAFEAKVVLARGRDRAGAQLQAYATFQLLHVLTRLQYSTDEVSATVTCKLR